MKVKWTEFKAFVNSRSISIQWVELTDKYILKAFDGPFNMECELDKTPSDTTDLIDFETNYKANGNKPFTSNGFPVMAPTLEHDLNLHSVWKGYSFTAPANSQSFHDIPIVTELKLRGGWYCILSEINTLDDYIEFSIVDKNNVLGYFGYYGLTPGVDVLELFKFVRTEYISPLDRNRQDFPVGSASDVVAGLFFRIGYNNAGNSEVKFKVTVHYLEE